MRFSACFQNICLGMEINYSIKVDNIMTSLLEMMIEIKKLNRKNIKKASISLKSI